MHMFRPAIILSAVPLLLCGGTLRAQAAAQPLSPVREAQIVSRGGQFQVTADNASLNQTLSQFARVAHIRLTGTTHEERIFGTYGPGTPATVLVQLLKGTQTNLVVRQDPVTSTVEATLTAQNGPATPPTPQVETSGLPSESGTSSPNAATQDRTGSMAASTAPGQAPSETEVAPPAPVPLTPAQRMALIQRLQQQQRQAAAAQQSY